MARSSDLICTRVSECDRRVAVEELGRASLAFEIHGPRAWWSGTAETEIFASLAVAERHLVPASGPELSVHVEDLRLRIERRFRSSDARRTTAVQLLAPVPALAPVVVAAGGMPPPPPPPPDRPAVQVAVLILHGGDVALRTTQRARRNASAIAGLLFVMATALLAVSLQHRWGEMTLAKPSAAVATASPTPILQPTPSRVPTPIPLPTTSATPAAAPSAWMIVLYGAVGGVVSVIPMAKRVARITRSSGAWTIQALFKVATGALVALVAAVLVQHVVLPVVAPQDAATLTAWALVFGYSQDAITRLLDQRLGAVTAPAPPGTAKDP